MNNIHPSQDASHKEPYSAAPQHPALIPFVNRIKVALEQPSTSDAEKFINEGIFATIDDTVFAKRTPIILGKLKKPVTGGRQEVVGPKRELGFDATHLGVVDRNGDEQQLERGYTYLVTKPLKDEKADMVTLYEIEIPLAVNGEPSDQGVLMTSTNALYENPVDNHEKLQELIKKYGLVA